MSLKVLGVQVYWGPEPGGEAPPPVSPGDPGAGCPYRQLCSQGPF